jgi:hypothetical protein
MWMFFPSPARCLKMIACGGVLIGFGCLALAADEAPFVTGLSPEERAAIGLDALTPEQRAALESAVERYVAGRSETLAAETTSDVRSSLAAEEEKRRQAEAALAAAQAELALKEQEVAAKEQEIVAARENESSLLERAKVLLTPGTQIEYATVNSTLRDEFKGWNEGTIFRLENGQNWRVSSGEYWSPREAAGKAVAIEPGAFGSFHMRIEGIRPTPKVELVSRN